MGGYALGSAFDSKSGQMIMVALLLMLGSFFVGNLFGNNAPIYISQVSETSSSLASSSSSSPGGGTHFKHGAAEYIQRLGNMATDKTGDLRSAGVVQVLDVGCGVASFSAYLLPLGGILLKEVSRLLRPKGYFVYSAPPAYRRIKIIRFRLPSGSKMKIRHAFSIMQNATTQKLPPSLSVCQFISDSLSRIASVEKNLARIPISARPSSLLLEADDVSKKIYGT
ncbi:hypothetical protein F3Y22_tig00116937pilonHSYRG00037 [Hibiscus syriacus]|uniref:Methyltransferase n=1 Tax=Hibiscus syriacus TaxID=106335 RepID=A0A6A2X2F9_HIBSY|nr:hypothetical protein F3Y22_tig00116937pilonHSYRG00037 [Hibiscus syriacus]